MPSFGKTYLSFYFVFLLCIVQLVASLPAADSSFHRRHLQPIGPAFPYGKLADRILNVNDVTYVKRDVDEREEDNVAAYALPPIPPASLQPSAIPKIGIIKSVLYMVYRIPDVIENFVA